jgi:hypothetical protein
VKFRQRRNKELERYWTRRPARTSSSEGVVAASAYLDVNTRPLARESHDGIGHHVFEEILRKPHPHRRGRSRCAESSCRLIIQRNDPARINAGQLWTIADLAALVDRTEPQLGKRGPYKKRVVA